MSAPSTGSVPSQIGPYRIEREIARGGMGIVYLARDTQLDRAVAIKALPEDVAADPERLARFEREAKTLASLRHPNIAGIYGIQSAEGRRYLVLERIEGETLAARLARGKLPIAEAVEICAQIAAGVEAAHESGVIHRDLKPGNVMITPEDHVKVLDFGLAKGKVAETESGAFPKSPTLPESPTVTSPVLPHSPTVISPATMPGVILGTASYLSPEQARGKPVDRRTDIWSFGCVLYECLTGKRVFEGETVSDTIAKILERDVDWKPLPGKMPPRIRELLQRCLEKDPRKRLRDIGEARLALEGVRAGATASPSGPMETTAPVPANPFTRFREAMQSHGYLFAAGLILGALIGVNMLARPRSATTGALPAHVSVPLPPGVHLLDAGAALGGRAILLVGTTQPNKDAPPQSRLYLRRLDGNAFEPIRGTEGAVAWVLSPDERWVLIAVTPSVESPQVRVFKMPLDGSGPPAAITVAGIDWSSPPVWLESGDLVLTQKRGTQFARIKPDGSAPVIRKLEVTGAQGRLVDVTTRGERLPRDRGVLLETWSQQGSALRIGTAVLDLKTGTARMLVQDGGSARYIPGYLLVSRQSTLFAVPFDVKRLEVKGEPVAILDGLYQRLSQFPGAFDLNPSGVLIYPPTGGAVTDRHLVVVDRAGKVTDWSSERKPSEFWIFASRDGARCATVLTSAGSTLEIWVSDRGGPSRRLGTDPASNTFGGAWSPDGTHIAYTQAGGAQDGIYIADVDGSTPPRRILASRDINSVLTVLSWSPDGTTLLGERKDGLYAIRIPAEPGALADPKPLFSDGVERFVARFSPDGRFISYWSDESGTTEVFVCRWDGRQIAGRPLQVSVGGGSGAVWSRDSKVLYYASAESKLMAVDVAQTPALRAGAPRVVYDLEALGVVKSFGIGYLIDFLPDGRMLAVRRGEGEGEPTQVNLVLNFGEELKQKLRAAGEAK